MKAAGEGGEEAEATGWEGGAEEPRENREGPGRMETARRIRGGAEDSVPKAQWLLCQALGHRSLKIGGHWASQWPQTHLCLLKSRPEGLHGRRLMVLLNPGHLGKHKIGVGWVPGKLEGHPPPLPQEDLFLIPGPFQTLKQDPDAGCPIS